jgi:tellurite resistance protein TerC
MLIISNNLFFIVFLVVVISLLMIDLLYVGKDKHVISLKESLGWTAIWVSIALLFYFFIYFYGHKIHNINNLNEIKYCLTKYSPNIKMPDLGYHEALIFYRKNMAMDYLTGYFLEYTLSIDNIFVILLILTGFSVSASNYKTVLFWGILGAIILRFLFIFMGAALIERFVWILYLFGLFLIYSGIKMFLDRNKSEKINVKDHPLVKFFSKYFNITTDFVQHFFWKRINGIFFFTPLFIVLILIEFTDLVFAFDSIPAIFSITLDPYIVFFSNIFAIIGLRSLFFLIIKIVDYFYFIKVGVSFLLIFVGIKLLFHAWLVNIGFKNIHSLFIILATLLVSILVSILFPKKENIA